DLGFAVRADQGDAGASFARQYAGEGAAILGLGDIVDVACLDGAVRVENGDEQRFRRLIAERGQVRADGLADIAELVAGRTVLGEDLDAAAWIAFHRENAFIGVDHFLPVRVGAAGEELGGPRADAGRLMLQQPLPAGRVDL